MAPSQGRSGPRSLRRWGNPPSMRNLYAKWLVAPMAEVWQLIMIWAIGTGAVATVAMLVALAVIFCVSLKLD